MKVKIRLDTIHDINQFLKVVNRITEDVCVEDGLGNRVTAKSMLFLSAARLEWNDIYCVCSKDISGALIPWIVSGSIERDEI